MPIIMEITKIVQNNICEFIKSINQIHDIPTDSMIEIWCKQEKMKPSDFKGYFETKPKKDVAEGPEDKIEDTVCAIVNGIVTCSLEEDEDKPISSEEEELSQAERDVHKKVKKTPKKREAVKDTKVKGTCIHVPGKGNNKGIPCGKAYKGAGPYCGAHKNMGGNN
jgi:hypothetical protein